MSLSVFYLFFPYPLPAKIERNLKKDKSVFWIPYQDLKSVIENLRDGKTSLRQRSQKAYDWFNSLTPNKFKPGHVAISPAELKALSSGLNRHQLTELFIAYFTACLHSQSKSQFIFKDKKNFMSHFGFNNSYNAMSWTSKQKQGTAVFYSLFLPCFASYLHVKP